MKTIPKIKKNIFFVSLFFSNTKVIPLIPHLMVFSSGKIIPSLYRNLIELDTSSVEITPFCSQSSTLSIQSG